MIDHMWKSIEEEVPDGCVRLEVMYAGGRISHMCSCDIHWCKTKQQMLPEYWRYDIL